MMQQVFLFPAVIIGMGIGVKLDKHIGEETTKKIVIWLLMISGAMLIIKNILN